MFTSPSGFIGVHLDVRGTGSSEGINTDEYMPIEQHNGYDAVEWCARQPWSNGRVGMFGTSYGGFTCIQVAMQRPPSLKAIVPIYATDDRYTDDCHYTRGGNMRMYYDVGCYGDSMVSMNALPPVAEYVGSNSAEMWWQRLEQNEPYILKWMAEQVDGPYWRGTSLRPTTISSSARSSLSRAGATAAQPDAPHLPTLEGAQEAAHGPLGSYIPDQFNPRPEDRFPQRNGAILRSLATG